MDTSKQERKQPKPREEAQPMSARMEAAKRQLREAQQEHARAMRAHVEAESLLDQAQQELGKALRIFDGVVDEWVKQ